MFKELLQEIIAGRDLSEEQMADLMGQILDGQATDAQIGAFMGALAAKGESFEELTGAAREMRRKAKRIQASSTVVVDTCGTGGDGANTFNISTTAAFVVAGCGITVAKHGNRSVSSKSGSADMLECLGMPMPLDAQASIGCLDALNFTFLFAPGYHPAMKAIMPVRSALGVRTVFNILGPLTNPAGANVQVLGVFSEKLIVPLAEVLGTLGAKRALVVHGEGNLDELTVTGTNPLANDTDHDGIADIRRNAPVQRIPRKVLDANEHLPI